LSKPGRTSLQTQRKPTRLAVPLGHCPGASTVERAKALKAEGMTLRQVADRLAEEGHKTRAGTPYQFTAVGRMISGTTRIPAPRGP
jgi:hypothetical protein